MFMSDYGGKAVDTWEASICFPVPKLNCMRSREIFPIAKFIFRVSDDR